MALPKQKIAARPESELRLSDLVRKLLREADAEGVLPTPLDRLFEIAKVTNIAELPDESFLRTLTDKAKGYFISAKQKLRGIADLRERVTYIPQDSNARRQRFVQAHELGHQVIPWHCIDPTYLDNSETLSPEVRVAFEQEANFFGAETVFQGTRFRVLARDYQPSFSAIFVLADRHEVSRQATAWRFVEEQDEAIALVQYYPGYAIDESGNCVLSAWRAIGSPSFLKKYAEIDLPRVLRTGHPWTAARDLNSECEGTDSLLVDGHPIAFQWRSWWNSHALLVLVRRKPMLSVVGGILRPS